jgi:hypothetical protein
LLLKDAKGKVSEHNISYQERTNIIEAIIHSSLVPIGFRPTITITIMETTGTLDEETTTFFDAIRDESKHTNYFFEIFGNNNWKHVSVRTTKKPWRMPPCSINPRRPFKGSQFILALVMGTTLLCTQISPSPKASLDNRAAKKCAAKMGVAIVQDGDIMTPAAVKVCELVAD